jgi:hypothetical protein
MDQVETYKLFHVTTRCYVTKYQCQQPIPPTARPIAPANTIEKATNGFANGYGQFS